jgi:hypothetical protein
MINASLLNFLFEVKYHLIYVGYWEQKWLLEHVENFIEIYLEDILQCLMMRDIV